MLALAIAAVLAGLGGAARPLTAAQPDRAAVEAASAPAPRRCRKARRFMPPPVFAAKTD